MVDTKKEQKTLTSAWEQTKQVPNFMWSKKMQSTSIAVAIMMGTTAFYTPILATTIGAAALTVSSLYLLTKTSDAVIDNVSAIGKKYKVPSILLGIGLGIVTSMPELAVSASSIMKDMADIGVGNIVGSNVANILLVLGATAAIAPIKNKGHSWKFNTAAMFGATVLFGGSMAMGALNPLMGVAMFGALGAYMWGSYKTAKKDQEELKSERSNATEENDEKTNEDNMPAWFNGAWAVLGTAGLVASANVLITGASSLATGMGVSPALIAAIGIAIGTSLPELVVSVKSAMQGKTEMAVGNILGSNIFNALMVGGVLAMAGTAVPDSFSLSSDLGLLNTGALVGAASLAASTLFMTKGKIARWHGFKALALYAAFTMASVGIENKVPEPPLIDEVKVETVAEQPAQQANLTSIKHSIRR